MKLKDLIARLQNEKTEYHEDEVEFVVLKKAGGEIITMHLAEQAKPLGRVLKAFG